MLQIFRDNLKYLSWVLWLVIGVFVVFMFTDFGGIAPGAGMAGAAAASVGGYDITYAEFEQAYRQQEAQMEQAYGDRIDPETARQLGLYRQVLEYLVTEKVLLAEGDRMGIEISDEEVREAILEFDAFKDEQGRFVGQDTYLSILRNARLTPESFEESIRQDMLTARVKMVLNHNIFVSDGEVETSYREQAERAKIRFLRLPANRFAEQVVLDDAEVAAYFADNQQSFEVPERRSADYLLVDRALLASEIAISDEEIAGYYRENEADYQRDEQVTARHILVSTGAERTLEEATRRINDARARIERGDDFAVVAAEISDDPGSKARGGDLGSFGRGQMVGPFEEAAFGAAPGELVGPVETNFGVHLIEVLNRTEGGQQPLDQVSTSISNRLAADRARELAETKAQELSDRIERENLNSPDELRALADQETGVTFLSTDPFAQGEQVTGIGRAAAFSRAAFATGVGEISEPTQIPRGWVILRVSDVQEPHIPELSAVETEVRSALLARKQQDLAVATLAEARERLEGGSTLDEVAADLGVEAEESAEFGVKDPIGSLGANRAVAKAALALDAGAVGGPIADAQGAILFEVVERQRFDPARFAEEKAETRAQLANQRAGEMLSALIAARRDELGVVYDPTFLENFEGSGS